MKVYVFGNQDSPLDNRVYEVAEKLKRDIKEIIPVLIKPNEDLPFTNKEKVIILDTVQGTDEVIVIDETGFDKLTPIRSISAHDYDLGFQLKYLFKLGKLGKVKIVGIPQSGKIDYFLIQSIFKKLVAQDIQGS